MGLLNDVSLIVWIALLGLKLWVLVDALLRSGPVFEAAGKLTKPAWVLILVLTALTHLLSPDPIGLLSIVGTVAAFVYLLDVRPAVAQLSR